MGTLGKVLLGVGVVAAGAAAIAGGIALANHLERKKFLPCSKCEALMKIQSD